MLHEGGVGRGGSGIMKDTEERVSTARDAGALLLHRAYHGRSGRAHASERC